MKKLLLFCLLLIAVPAFGATQQVPALFSYQGVLSDEGGNPLPDGISNLKFQISNSAGGILYEETQDVDVAKGQVSVLVGNGLNPLNGAPTGGIPSDIFNPTDTYYLQVEVEGQKPYDRLEIVAQPYSLWSNTALGLVDGALTGAMVGEKVIEKKHFSDELMADLKAEFEETMAENSLSQDSFKEFKTAVQAGSGAGQVGVTNNFVYSGAQTVQGVLSDFDLAIKKRQEEVDFVKKDYNSKITDEATTRQNTDKALQTNINDEATARSTQDGILQKNINDEVAARDQGDVALQGNINIEVDARSKQDGVLQSNINDETSARSQQDGVLQANINNEASTRNQQDGALQANIDNHAAAISAHGSDGNLVGTNTLNSTVSTVFSSIGGMRVDVLTSDSSNWTVPSGVTSVKITCVGGGGGGGGGSDNSSGHGAGGGGQMLTPLSFTAISVTPGQQIAYTVGAGGAGGAGGSEGSDGSVGDAGGGSSFGPISCPGASGGAGGHLGTIEGGEGIIVGSNPGYNSDSLKILIKGRNGGVYSGSGGYGAPGIIGYGGHGNNGSYHSSPAKAGVGGDGYGAGGGGGESATGGDNISGDTGGAGAGGVIIVEY